MKYKSLFENDFFFATPASKERVSMKRDLLYVSKTELSPAVNNTPWRKRSGTLPGSLR